MVQPGQPPTTNPAPVNPPSQPAGATRAASQAPRFDPNATVASAQSPQNATQAAPNLQTQAVPPQQSQAVSPQATVTPVPIPLPKPAWQATPSAPRGMAYSNPPAGQAQPELQAPQAPMAANLQPGPQVYGPGMGGAGRKKKSNRGVWIVLLVLALVGCLAVAGGGYYLYSSGTYQDVLDLAQQAGVSLPFLATSTSTPTRTPARTSTKASTPTLSASATSQSPSITPTTAASGSPVNTGKLSALMLSGSEINPGWANVTPDIVSQNNSEYAANVSNSAEALTNLNNWGRLANLDYRYKAPGDLCKSSDGLAQVIVDVTILKNADGALQFYKYGISGTSYPTADVGDISDIGSIKQNARADYCNSKYTHYVVDFLRNNVVVYLSMDVMDGKATNDTMAKNQVKLYAKLIDQKIVANSK